MIVYGFTLFRCVQSQTYEASSKPCLNHDLETYVYFSQYSHDHYVIKSTVSTFGVCARPFINLLFRSVLFGECRRPKHQHSIEPYRNEAYWIPSILV